jgi:hypothetical protein
MRWEYKVVGAPERAGRHRGARTGSERAAAELAGLIEAHAVDGWEYDRTEILPVRERRGMLSQPVETHRAVVVFRRQRPEGGTRPLFAAQRPDAGRATD